MGYSLEYYKQQEKTTRNQMEDRRKKNERLSREISRLQTAYNKLGQIKRNNSNNAQWVKDKAKLSYVANSLQWRGNTKKQFDDAMKNRVQPAAKKFYDSIDKIQDEIGTALDRKKGEYDTGVRLFNSLNRKWQNVCGTIRNWVN